MNGRFPQKVLITGASSGLGRAIAQRFLREGALVWGTSRDGARLPEGVAPLALDLANPDSVTALLTVGDGDFDVVVNNAGSGAFFAADQFPEEVLRTQLESLLTAQILISRHFYSQFLHKSRGTLVNVTSLAGDFPIPYMSAYSAAKAGLSAFTGALILEAPRSGVVIIDFRPGDLATGFNGSMPGFDSVASDAGRRVARACDRHVNAGASAEVAAESLFRAVMRGRSGVVVSGTFWQARVGPMLARFVPRGWVFRYLKNFYEL